MQTQFCVFKLSWEWTIETGIVELELSLFEFLETKSKLARISDFQKEE